MTGVLIDLLQGKVLSTREGFITKAGEHPGSSAACPRLEHAILFRQMFCRKALIMNIRELSELTGQAERQIRYMIAEGFVPPPSGGRATADYGEDHVTAIRRYTVLRQQGLPPQAIRVLLASGQSAPFPVAPGIALHVDPSLIGVPMDADALADRVRKVLKDILQEPTDAQHHTAARRRSR
jgi:DNA-binding transcriptional MerR regulator